MEGNTEGKDVKKERKVRGRGETKNGREYRRNRRRMNGKWRKLGKGKRGDMVKGAKRRHDVKKERGQRERRNTEWKAVQKKRRMNRKWRKLDIGKRGDIVKDAKMMWKERE